MTVLLLPVKYGVDMYGIAHVLSYISIPTSWFGLSVEKVDVPEHLCDSPMDSDLHDTYGYMHV